MSDITAERRLELIRCIREENNRNRVKMRSRVHILYGKKEAGFTDTYTGGYEDTAYEADYAHSSAGNRDTEKSKLFSGLWVRTLLATVLFAAYVIVDFSGSNIFSVNADDIYTHIRKNYAPNVIDFMEEITYTLKDM